jgi:hypothetical protein
LFQQHEETNCTDIIHYYRLALLPVFATSITYYALANADAGIYYHFDGMDGNPHFERWRSFQ